MTRVTQKRIEDYAIIGDGQTAALLSRTGSIEWLCLPRFDSDACFAALLGDERHGSWSIAPESGEFETKRRYLGDTLVLETTLTTPQGSVQLLDFMPIRDHKHPAVIRIVLGMEGEVAMHSRMNLRFDYGTVAPWYSEEDSVIIGKVGPDLAAIRASVPLQWDAEGVEAKFVVKAGEQVSFTLQHDGSTGPTPGPIDAQHLLRETKSWWLDWISKFDAKTEWPDFLKRSLITLKALIYMPTGGIVAAPTAGLPEKPGGRMNWDYRYCWLRDSTFTLTALLNSGYKHEAQEWLRWMLRAIAGNPDRVRIAYRVDGGRHLNEWRANWLPGFNRAYPVRIGNSAAGQRQLDIFGELIDSCALAERAGLERREWGIEVERRLVLQVEEIWRKPDQGLWESRGRPRQYVYSKVMSWVAVNRFLKMQSAREHCDAKLIERLQRLERQMHTEICIRGYSKKHRRFVAYYGTSRLDASLLLLPVVGFLPIGDPRIAGTIAAIETELMEGGFVRRHKAPMFGTEEGSFIACACWLADCMSMQGRKEEAREMLRRVMGAANDVGLLSEEYHVPRQQLLGNFPQALSHLAFLNAALGLDNAVLQRGGG